MYCYCTNIIKQINLNDIHKKKYMKWNELTSWRTPMFLSHCSWGLIRGCTARCGLQYWRESVMLYSMVLSLPSLAIHFPGGTMNTVLLSNTTHNLEPRDRQRVTVKFCYMLFGSLLWLLYSYLCEPQHFIKYIISIIYIYVFIYYIFLWRFPQLRSVWVLEWFVYLWKYFQYLLQ